MRSTHLSVVVAAFASAWILAGCAATGSTATAAAAAPARITVLYDAFGKNAVMSKDWGYAALVEISGKRILFDTGDDPAIFAKEGFGIFGSDLPSKFYRKDESLPAEMRYYDGAPPEIMKFGTVFPGANIVLIDK